MHGAGVLRRKNGVKYKGGFVGGLEHGAGVAEDKNGVRYEGTFENGMRHGKFIIKDKNGDVLRECIYNSGNTEQ